MRVGTGSQFLVESKDAILYVKLEVLNVALGPLAKPKLAPGGKKIFPRYDTLK